MWLAQCLSYSYALSSYEDLMSKAVSAYADNELVKSEAYIKQALDLRPGDISATKMLKDLHTDMSRAWEDKAQTAFHQERWLDALHAYQRIKTLNVPQKDFSKQMSLIMLYIEAEKRLDKYVADIEDLINSATRQNAMNTLKEIEQFGLSGKVINQNIEKLKQMLAKLDKVYNVDVTSDGESEVIIYKVGNLGKFIKQSVTLSPGHYIAVARCEGHKEFRHQFKVLPDHNNGFYIRCGGEI